MVPEFRGTVFEKCTGLFTKLLKSERAAVGYCGELGRRDKVPACATIFVKLLCMIGRMRFSSRTARMNARGPAK
jgi:hypothetical protein